MDAIATPKYKLITYGCQMNKNDSERIAALLKGLGFLSTDDETESDLILVNTCSVRQGAEDRVFGQARAWKALKEKNPKLVVGVTGCMPGRDRSGALRKKLPIVDLFFPISEMTQLPRWLGELRPELVNSPDLLNDYFKINPDRQNFRQAFVSIQTGCNKFCTYCVVPFARGLEKNRPVTDILDEIKHIVARGGIEITLLGQTVNSYRAPDPTSFSPNNPFKDHFAALLWEVNQIPEIKRLHFTAPHPLHMTDEVIEAMGLPAHVNFIHLPVQAGSDEVLRRMNRRYTAAQFLDVIARIKKRHPTMTIGTDMIVGFCGETKEQFEKTLEIYKASDFDIAYTAQYSVRSGTAAWRAFKDDVTREEKKRRWLELQQLMESWVFKKNQKYVGQTVSVLVDRHEPPKITDEMLALPGKIQDQLAAKPGMCFGNSREMKLVSFPGSKDLVGQIVNVKIEKAETWILYGKQV